MFVLQKSRNRASSRSQIAIKGVHDGILELPGNRYRIVLQVSSLNFELRSEEEQDTIIDTYESFLNSLNMELQILIRTREIDLDKYLLDLNTRLSKETEPVYRLQIEAYGEFIRSLITTNKILTRHFYVIIPHTESAKADFDVVKEQLYIKMDIVKKGLARLGMHSKKLSSLETLDLFYSFYSPSKAKIQPLTEQALRLLHSSVIQKEVIHE